MPGLFDGTPLERPVTCEHCGQPLPGGATPGGACCRCPRDGTGQVVRTRDLHPRVRREKRHGKWCTIVADIGEPASAGGATDLKALLKLLRTGLGTGGGIAETEGRSELVLQGDHREAVVARLRGMGYQAKAAGDEAGRTGGWSRRADGAGRSLGCGRAGRGSKMT
ncbi:MAG: hypothetical protein IPJ41_10575 [Phycisphaerales bacterium]|nr:hypothetical protein [Phycisphaerales bacterium]